MGKNNRKRLTDEQINKNFSTELKAEAWFIAVTYGRRDKMYCPRCGSTKVRDIKKRKPMPFMCDDCRKFFSIRTGTVMEKSRLPLTIWAKSIYEQVYHLRGMPAVVTMNKFGVAKNTAWFLNHRIRKAFENGILTLQKDRKFTSEVEFDETFIGGKVANMKPSTRKRFEERGGGQGGAGKQIVIAAKERKTGKIVTDVIPDRKSETLQGFVEKVTDENAVVMTDDAKGYVGVKREHQTINHSSGIYAYKETNVQGIESHWATIKRGITGNFFAISPKHTKRYMMEFAGRHNIRPLDTDEQIIELARSMKGVRLTYKELTADNGLDNFARPVKGSEWDKKRIRKNVVKAEVNALRKIGKPNPLPNPPKLTSKQLEELLDDHIPY